MIGASPHLTDKQGLVLFEDTVASTDCPEEIVVPEFEPRPTKKAPNARCSYQQAARKRTARTHHLLKKYLSFSLSSRAWPNTVVTVVRRANSFQMSSAAGATPPSYDATGSDARRMLEEVMSYLSLGASQAARVLRVERPTIYAWLSGTKPHPERFKRLQTLCRLARQWRSHDVGCLGAKVALPFADGPSLLDLLAAEHIDEEEILKRLRQVAEHLRGRTESPFVPRMSRTGALLRQEPPEVEARQRELNRDEHRLRRYLKKVD